MIPENVNQPLPRITSIEATHQGQRWEWPRIDAEQRWVNWYYRNYDGLFPSKGTLANGLLNLNVTDLIVPPVFSNSSDFYLLAMTSDVPRFWAKERDDQTILDAIEDQVFEHITNALFWWSIKYRAAILLRSDQRVSVIDPSSVIPVNQSFDQDDVHDHVIFYIYRSQQTISLPDRIRFIEIHSNESPSTYRDHQLESNIIGSLIDEGFTDAISVLTWGKGNSYYPDVAPLVRELAIRRSSNSQLFNRLQNPHLEVPDTFDDTQMVGPRSQLLPRSEEDSRGFRYLTWEGGAKDVLDHIADIKREIHETTGTPEFAEGGDAGGTHSGVSRDRSLFKASSRIKSTRIQTEPIIKSLFNHMTGQDIEISIDWPVDPFSSVAQQRASAASMFTAGVANRREARRMAGLLPLDTEEDNVVLESVGTAPSAPS